MKLPSGQQPATLFSRLSGAFLSSAKTWGELSACAALAEELTVVLKGSVSPQAVDAWHAWDGGIPKEEVSWRELLEAREVESDFGVDQSCCGRRALPGLSPNSRDLAEVVGDEGLRRTTFQGLEEVEVACPQWGYSCLEMRHDHC